MVPYQKENFYTDFKNFVKNHPDISVGSMLAACCSHLGEPASKINLEDVYNHTQACQWCKEYILQRERETITFS